MGELVIAWSVDELSLITLRVRNGLRVAEKNRQEGEWGKTWYLD